MQNFLSVKKGNVILKNNNKKPKNVPLKLPKKELFNRKVFFGLITYQIKIFI